MLQFWAAKGAGGEEIKPWLLSEDMIIYVRILPKFAKYLLEYSRLTSTKYVDTPSINVIYIKILVRYL